MNETSRVIRPLLEFLLPSAAPETLTLIHGYIRKFAHFAEYAVLAFFALRALMPYKHRFAVALAFAAVVATVDELNQSLDPSRTSSPWDVALDIAGAASTVFVSGVLAIVRHRRRTDLSSPATFK